MKLDPEVVRDVLLAVEASDADPDEGVEIAIDGKSELELSYHVHLMNEAGFLVALDCSSDDGHAWQAQRLTYKGHEFLDTVRDEKVWKLTKAGAKKAGVAGVGVILEIGKVYAKQVIAERTGIDLG